MRVSLNLHTNTPSMSGKKSKQSNPDTDITTLLQPFSITKKAKVAPLNLMVGINPNNNNVFDTFTKIDDVTRQINFVKSQEAWDECLMEEIEEFKIARREYQQNKTAQNYDHMEEEMGDIFYTAASIAKDSGIDPKEAFKTTNRKFYNRVNIMERLAASSKSETPHDLKDCTSQQRRSFWNVAKRRLYDAQALTYANQQNTSIEDNPKA